MAIKITAYRAQDGTLHKSALQADREDARWELMRFIFTPGDLSLGSAIKVVLYRIGATEDSRQAMRKWMDLDERCDNEIIEGGEW